MAGTERVPTARQAGDEDAPAPAGHRRPAWLEPLRTRVVTLPAGTLVWRVGVWLLGAAVIVIGLALIPLPGPGWAIVFLGLAIWATEFHWARRLLGHVRRLLTGWTNWVRGRSRAVQVLIGVLGLALTATVIYLSWRWL